MELEAVARLPVPGDNVAIAARPLAAGLALTHAERQFTLALPVLVGHRFAAQPLAVGDQLLSWGLPFGRATRPIAPGDYVCNAAMLEALADRRLPFTLPSEPNFEDYAAAYTLDEAAFVPGVQVAPYPVPRTFNGYPRAGGRGVGTRNHLVALGLTSRVSGFVRALAAKLTGASADYAHLDPVVAVAHTEGAGAEPLNNRDLLLRALAGFVVHPNVGAVLIVDDGGGQITNADLRAYLRAQGYPLEHVPHVFFETTGQFEADLERAAAQLLAWMPSVGASARQPSSLRHLNLALQCGGSDAFSGVTANPLAGAVARELLRHGGAACLAETTELVGAEAYLLRRVRDVGTIKQFLAFSRRYQDLLAWHGVTGEGNVSGGNRFRGLYNIILKSVGAAAKLDPAVRLDYAVAYAQRMTQPGYYFMDTPGNDLESVAGQVAGGCNLIMFTTGNGSITNFPFVPTIKVMTTTARYQLLEREMDLNAGAYLDGAPLDVLTSAAVDLTVAIASGRPSKGELAGHSQVSIWRNWRQTGPGQAAAVLAVPEPDGAPLPALAHDLVERGFRIPLWRTEHGLAADRVGLILPTSLCAGQVARLAANRLNDLGLGHAQGLSRFVALVHTEGCGSAGHSTGALYHRPLLNYMAHPLVARGLFLEHGCEKTHNDYMRARLAQFGRDAAQYGWASVQLDGGLDAVLAKIEAWFRAALQALPPAEAVLGGLGDLRVGVSSAGDVPPDLAAAFARVVRTLVAAGGTVVLPAGASLLRSPAFVSETFDGAPRPTLAYGQLATPGLHLMDTPSSHWVEALTGLGATGVDLILAAPGAHPAQGHPLVPLGQVGLADGFDLTPAGDPSGWAEQVLALAADVAARRYVPRRLVLRDVDFQLTRGLLGVTV
ncbi:MAG: UxaA family hydrolase [Anaerolineales bacterium]|nr:UxaA family hydrolase [Anaerolineales bacterium]